MQRIFRLRFYAYDDIYSPTATASTVVSSKGMLKKVAFAHWNSLAATGFDFAPDETLDFTSDGNDQYGTADSAMQCTMILEQSSREKKEL